MKKYHAMMVGLLVLVTILSQPVWAGWQKASIGTVTNWAFGIAIGPGRNDGINRVYVASWSRLYEFTWNGSSWDRVDIGPTLGWEVALGCGRNDGLVRVYCTFTVTGPQYGGVYEFTWDGSSWVRQTVCTFPSSPSSSAGHGIAVGPGRNDGINRVYACDCNNNRTFESTWDGSSWNTVQAIPDWSGTEFLIGSGRSDNVARVYIAYIGGQLREYSWTGSGWTYVNIDPASSSYYDVWIGAGRNDGRNRVYSGDGRFGSYSLVEFNWNGTNWDKTTIGPMPNLPNCITVGPGRNDLLNRVYSGTTGGTRFALEYTWNNTTWDSTWVDAAGTSGVAYCDAIAAKARNDGIDRLYITSSDSNIYEFIYTTEVAQENLATPPTDAILKVYPNPFRQSLGIRLSALAKEEISLKIYDISGRCVRTLISNQSLKSKTQSLSWDGKDDFAQELPNGVYYVNLVSKNYRLSKTVVLTK